MYKRCKYLMSQKDFEKQSGLSRDVFDGGVGKNKRVVRVAYLAMILLSVLLLGAGTSYSQSVLRPLKTRIVKDFGINNAKYGVLSSSNSLLNTVLPLIGGIMIDSYGTGFTAIYATFFIAFGDLLSVLACYQVNYAMLTSARVVYGLGSGIIISVQMSILNLWFGATHSLALSLGILATSTKFFNWVSQITVIPLTERNLGKDVTSSTPDIDVIEFKFIGNAYWLSFGLSFVGFLTAVGYYKFNKWYNCKCIKKDEAPIEEYYMRINRSIEMGGSSFRGKLGIKTVYFWRRSKLSLKQLLIALPRFYFSLPVALLILGSTWTPFLQISNDYIKKRYEVENNQTTSYIASIGVAFPIVFSPVVGIMLDYVGNRGLALMACTVCAIVGLVCLGYGDINPAIGMSFFSISLAIGPVILNSSIRPILEDNKPIIITETAIARMNTGVRNDANDMSDCNLFNLLDWRNYVKSKVMALVNRLDAEKEYPRQKKFTEDLVVKLLDDGYLKVNQYKYYGGFEESILETGANIGPTRHYTATIIILTDERPRRDKHGLPFNQSRIGIAVGFYRAILGSGITITNVIVGVIQDSHASYTKISVDNPGCGQPGNKPCPINNDPSQYEHVLLYFLLQASILGILISSFICVYDLVYQNRLLDVSERERRRRLANAGNLKKLLLQYCLSNEVAQSNSTGIENNQLAYKYIINNKFNLIVYVISLLLVISAWALYFNYLIK